MIDDGVDVLGSGSTFILFVSENRESAVLEAVDLLLLSSGDFFGFGDCFTEGVDGGDGV